MDHARRASLEPSVVPAVETEVEDRSSVLEAKRAREEPGEDLSGEVVFRPRQQAESMAPTGEHSSRGESKTQQICSRLKGGAKKPELAKVLCENSGADVAWLMDKVNLDLSLAARLGGHQARRTH